MGFFRFLFSKTFLRQLVIAVVLAVVGFLGLNWYLDYSTDHDTYITVPNLEGVSWEEAQTTLANLELQGLLVDSIWSADQTPGFVCEQSPAFGAQVKRGRPVFVTAYRYLPSLVKVGVEEGERKNVAVIRLANKGLDYTIKYEPHELLYDCVIRVEHKGKALGPKDQILRNEKLVLVVGERRDEKVLVPHLYGFSLDSARKALEYTGLTVGFTAYDEELPTAEDSAACWIYEQRPFSDRDHPVRMGSEVNLWLTARPHPSVAPADSLDYDDPNDLFNE